MSLNDYLLCYKRATTYFSMSPHPQALEDFEKVPEQTPNLLDKACLTIAWIHAKDDQFSAVPGAIKKDNIKIMDDPAVREVLFQSSSRTLQTASRSIILRHQRADCAVAAGDVASAIGDLARLAHLTTPDTVLLMNMLRVPRNGDTRIIKKILKRIF
ncbi:hypothetical protein BDW22DRAFT_1364004 [Trametopsis cervina]|nr:hypothetical protein BDW22DRAFT_1364004 [Trametopsis cervina]